MGRLQDELNALLKQGEWVKMGTLIDDEILNTFAVVGEPEQIAPELHKPTAMRQPDLVLPAVPADPDRWRGVLEALKAA